jgi:uncharacterized cupredoxin-like copper-binding protein
MRVRLVGAAMVAAAAVALTGCGSSGSASGTAAPPAGSSGSGGSSAADGSSSVSPGGEGGTAAVTAVTVTATDFKLSLPSTHLVPGAYTFTMANDGHATHAIEIDGPGVSDQKSSTAGPGGSATLTVTLQPGTYELYCPIGNHRALGMQTALTVG